MEFGSIIALSVAYEFGLNDYPLVQMTSRKQKLGPLVVL